MKHRTRTCVLTATLASATLALSACAGSGTAGEDKTVSIGYVPWDEVTAATYLWEHILEEQGYTVEVTQLEPAAVYAAVAQNNTDLFLAAIPETQGDYWDEFGYNFTSVAEWYKPLKHSLVVPEYVDVDSITDLEGRAAEFGGRIVGIEPGSGLMKETTKAAEAYDLSGYDVIEGSSAAMLAEFERAVAAQEPIVAAAWNPHWAVAEYGMKFLEDPENVYVDGGVYHVIASEDAQEKQELISLLDDFSMSDEDLMPLLTELRDAGSGNEAAAVDAWLEDDANQALVDSWINNS
jgi:glycine betaine/proline transport system substrate-binding protein